MEIFELLLILIIMATVFVVLTYIVGNTILILARIVEISVNYIKSKN